MGLRSILMMIAVALMVAAAGLGCGDDWLGGGGEVTTINNDEQDDDNDSNDENDDNDQDNANDGNDANDGNNTNNTDPNAENNDSNNDANNDSNNDANNDANNDDNGGNGGNDDCTDLNDPGCDFDCEDLSTWPDEWLVTAVDVVDETNDVRGTGATCQGQSMPAVGSVSSDARLEEAARCHSLDMAQQGTISHTGSDGSSPGDRISDVGYNFQFLGENLAMGQPTAVDAVDAWLGSDQGHCENLMNSDYEDIGVGVVIADGVPYYTQKFGTEF